MAGMNCQQNQGIAEEQLHQVPGVLPVRGQGTGSWKITGNKNPGTISFPNRGGKTTTYKYEVGGEGCIYIGSVKFAYS